MKMYRGLFSFLLLGVLMVPRAAPQLMVAGNEVWHQGLDGIVDSPETRDRFGSTVAIGDFNGDRNPDLAIGVPDQDVESVPSAGAVHVIYGVMGGLDPAGNEVWTEASEGIGGQIQGTDDFGAALATGDFNSDDYDDLAIGVPGESDAGAPLAGAVVVIYGSSDGLTSEDSQFWSQGSPSVRGDPEGGENFGAALAVGDFNGDGSDDLAIGVPRDAIDQEIFGAGAVNVVYGSSNDGLRVSSNQLWHQNVTDISGTADVNDRLGSALAAGDFNGDSFDDLAIGVPNEDIDEDPDAGAVNVIYGSESRLVEDGEQFWSADSSGVEGSASENDHFGASLAAGDFDSDGFDDLAIGVPDEGVGSEGEAGEVNVLFGKEEEGLDEDDDQLFNRNSGGILGSAREGENFGAALVTGDFDGDGFQDLAIGVPFGEVDDTTGAGSVNVIYGDDDGLTNSGDQLWSQDSDGIVGTEEQDDNFGSALAAGDFNQDDFDDLAIGVPGQDVGSVNEAGATHTIFGSSGGVSGKNIVSAADFLVGPIAPGQIISIFVEGVGPSQPADGTGAMVDDGRITTTLSEVEVRFDDVPGALFFVGPNQINAQVSYSVAGDESVGLQIINDGEEVNPVPVRLPVQPSAPGLFMVPGDEPRVIAVHLDGSLNSPSNRIHPGEFVTLYATGEGQTSPPGVDGKLAEEPLPVPLGEVQVKIGDVSAEPDFAGSAPGFAGLLQINVEIPPGVPSGTAVPIRLCVGDIEGRGSATISIAVP